MSRQHPIIAVTGSSGAGTTTVMQSFQHIFRREGLAAQIVEGDSFHRFDRAEMRARMKEAEAGGNKHYSHFGPYSNLLEELEALFRGYGASGRGRVRKYVHDDREAAEYGVAPGCFTGWQDIEPGSPDESYVSDALVAMGRYLKKGIPDSPVRPDPVAAQEYFMRAAATYRNPNAQFEMGKIFLLGDGGVKASVRQAGRWLQLAAEKGHAGAQATLGNLLFESGKVVRGLAMMTAALERANPIDRAWIQTMQEEAFAVAGEADRRTAIALAQDILTKGE